MKEGNRGKERERERGEGSGRGMREEEKISGEANMYQNA